MDIIKYELPHDLQRDPEQDILAMWILFLATPCQRNANPDGSWELGEIGSVREKRWTRLTPYSLAGPLL